MDKKISQYLLEYKDDFYNTNNKVILIGFENGKKWEKSWMVKAEYIDYIVDMLRFEEPVYYSDTDDSITTSKTTPEIAGEHGLQKDSDDKSAGEKVKVVSYVLKYLGKGVAEISVGWNTKAGTTTIKKIDVDAGHLAYVTEILRIEQEIYYNTATQVLSVEWADPGCLFSNLPVPDGAKPVEGDWIVRKYWASYDCKAKTHNIAILKYIQNIISGQGVVTQIHNKNVVFCNDEQAWHVLKMLHRIKEIEYDESTHTMRSVKPITCSSNPKVTDSSATTTITGYTWEFKLPSSGLKTTVSIDLQGKKEKEAKNSFILYAQDGDFLMSLFKDSQDARTQPGVSTVYSDLVVGWNEYHESVSVDQVPAGFVALKKLREKYDVKASTSRITFYWKTADGSEKGREITPSRSWLKFVQDLLKWESPVFWNPDTKTILTGREFVGEEDRNYKQAMAHTEVEIKPVANLGNIVATMVAINQSTGTSGTAVESMAGPEQAGSTTQPEEPLGSDYVPVIDVTFEHDKKARFTFTWDKRGEGPKSKTITLKNEYTFGIFDLLGKKKARWLHEPSGDICFVFKVDEASERPVAGRLKKVRHVIVRLAEKSDKPRILVNVVDRSVAPEEMDVNEKTFGAWAKMLITASTFAWNPDTKALQGLF